MGDFPVIISHHPPSSADTRRGRLLLAYSSSLLLGAAHVILQPRPSPAWEAENPQAWRGFLQDIFVAPAASGGGWGIFLLVFLAWLLEVFHDIQDVFVTFMRFTSL